MSYKQEAEAYKVKAQKNLGDQFKIVTDDMDRVRSSGVLDHALKVNDFAPDFSLPDAFGYEISLKTLLKAGPVVISFYRGEWCPFCNLELHALQEALPRINKLGANLVAISPEKPDGGIIVTEKNKLTFPVLSDFKNAVARQFGIVFRVGDELQDLSRTVFKNDLSLRNGEDTYELPVPATFVIDGSGMVRFAHVNVDYMTGRAEPEEVVAALEVIVQSVAR
ncbi:MAG: peroxiredoxin-like family protein [Terriglobia bacterium]